MATSHAILLNREGQQYNTYGELKTPTAVKKPARVVIDESKCKGCDLCVYYCPQETLALSKTLGARGYPVAIVIQDNCTGCQECARVCPDVCIDIWRE